MTNILLSIKPEFADKILSGQKKYEYRRIIFKERDINKVILYASKPVKMVIGEFVIGSILEDNVKTLWTKTKEHSGLSENDFFDYFKNKEFGFAIEIKSIRKYKKPLRITDFGVLPPQSFVYIEGSNTPAVGSA